MVDGAIGAAAFGALPEVCATAVNETAAKVAAMMVARVLFIIFSFSLSAWGVMLLNFRSDWRFTIALRNGLRHQNTPTYVNLLIIRQFRISINGLSGHHGQERSRASGG